MKFGDSTVSDLSVDIGKTYNTTMEVGYNGLGIPKPRWEAFQFALNQSIYINSNNTYFVYKRHDAMIINMTCASALVYCENLDFNLTLAQQSELVFKLPISSIMRNIDLDGHQQCLFLAESIGSDKDE